MLRLTRSPTFTPAGSKATVTLLLALPVIVREPGSCEATVSSVTACDCTAPALPASSTTRVCTVQLSAWLLSSCALHWVPSTKAAFQVLPPSVDTCRVSPAARGALSWPIIRRPALPSLVR
ncbi:hypothetical protein D3C87_1260550 [compost metagenome]